MKYGLVVNNKIECGPREYIVTLFQDRLNELGFDLPKDLTSNVRFKTNDEPILTAEWSLLPVTQITSESLLWYQQPAGPNFTINEDSIFEHYTAADKPIEQIKYELITKVAANRYKKETADIKLKIQDTDIIIEGDRTNKMMVIQIYGIMQDDTVYNFKFPKSQNWLPLTKSDMGLIVAAFITQTQEAFDWENATTNTINAATDFTALAEIDLGNVPLFTIINPPVSGNP